MTLGEYTWADTAWDHTVKLQEVKTELWGDLIKSCTEVTNVKFLSPVSSPVQHPEVVSWLSWPGLRVYIWKMGSITTRDHKTGRPSLPSHTEPAPWS